MVSRASRRPLLFFNCNTETFKAHRGWMESQNSESDNGLRPVHRKSKNSARLLFCELTLDLFARHWQRQILTDDIVMVLLTDFHAIQSQEGNTAGVHIRPSHLPSGIFEDWTPSAPHGLVLNHELQVSCHGVKPEKASAIAFRDHLHCHPNWWDNGLDDAAATSSQIRAQSAQSHSFWTVSHQVKAKANHRG